MECKAHYDFYSPFILILLFGLLLTGVVVAFVLFGQYTGDEWKMWSMIAAVFVVVVGLGVVSRVQIRKWVFDELRKVTGSRGFLVCPYDLGDLERVETDIVPHQFVRCTECRRVAGQENVTRLWKNCEALALSNPKMILVEPVLDQSTLVESDYHCPVDKKLLTPLASVGDLSVFGLCEDCGCVYPYQAIMQQRVLDDELPGKTQILMMIFPNSFRIEFKRMQIHKPTVEV